jgi:hypothetical protein
MIQKFNFYFDKHEFEALTDSFRNCEKVIATYDKPHAIMMREILLKLAQRLWSRKWHLTKRNTVVLSIPEAMAFYTIFKDVVVELDIYTQIVVQKINDRIEQEII